MQVAYCAAWHANGKRPRTDAELEFTEDPDTIARVYEDGPASCMNTGRDIDTHPTRIYGGGGLALAYMTSTSGGIVARALCWPKRGVFGRVYPTANGNSALQALHDELHDRLKEKGWTSITEDNTVFDGALLRKIRHHRYSDTWLMPYLDNDYGVKRHRDENGKDWWMMDSDADQQCSQHSVYINVSEGLYDHDPDDDDDDEDRWTCDECGDSYPEYESQTCVYDRWRPSPGRRGGGGGGGGGYAAGESYWCESCVSNNTFYCDGSEEHEHLRSGR